MVNSTTVQLSTPIVSRPMGVYNSSPNPAYLLRYTPTSIYNHFKQLKMHLLTPLLALLTLSSPTFAADDISYMDAATFKSEMLRTHNSARSQHSASPVSWDASLASFALALVSKCNFAHSGGPNGENLAMGYPRAGDAVGAWVNERDKFNFENGGFSGLTGHFTQVVWKATSRIGCQREKCGSSW